RARRGLLRRRQRRGAATGLSTLPRRNPPPRRGGGAHGGGFLPLGPDRPRRAAPEPAIRARPAPPGGAGGNRLPERARRPGAGDRSAVAVRALPCLLLTSLLLLACH